MWYCKFLERNTITGPHYTTFYASKPVPRSHDGVLLRVHDDIAITQLYGDDRPATKQVTNSWHITSALVTNLPCAECLSNHVDQRVSCAISLRH